MPISFATTAINPSTLQIIGVLLVIVGILLAFFGRKVWTPFMSFVGAIIGGTLGYIIGGYYVQNGYVAALIFGLVGSVLGSIVFNYLVKIALALIAAAIPAALTYYALGGNAVADQSAQSTPVMVAILVLLVVFAVAYYFVEELIGVVTGLIGGFLVGTGIFLALGNTTLALEAGGAVFLIGAAVQTLAIRAAKRGAVWRLRRAKAVATTPAPSPYIPPANPPPIPAAPVPAPSPPLPPPENPSTDVPPPPPPP